MELTAEFNKKEKVLVLKNKDKVIKEVMITEEDEWFGSRVKNTEYDFNYYEGKLGLYSTEKVGKNTYKTGDFLDEVKVLEI
jgi:hypothetical protein